MKYTSRRSFLSSLAILSAGAGLASVPGVKLAEASSTALQELWIAFCRKNNGRKMTGKFSFIEEALPAACKGHLYKAGDAMRFPSNMVAVPTWVYWSNDRVKPSDLLVTFFEEGVKRKKIIRLNRFELEALSVTIAQGSEIKIENLLPDFYETYSGKTATKKKVKTSITKDGKANITSHFNGQSITLRKQFFNI
ncbi:MAG: hypothetical protein V4717_22515 [Bacteroidota bacterium]